VAVDEIIRSAVQFKSSAPGTPTNDTHIYAHTVPD
jgi:hypothetical protein